MREEPAFIGSLPGGLPAYLRETVGDGAMKSPRWHQLSADEVTLCLLTEVLTEVRRIRVAVEKSAPAD